MNNLTWHQQPITKAQREQRNGHSAVILWFTGLSGSGKSTIADATAQALHQRHIATYLLDGDNIRHGLCADLGFTAEDRIENIRRVAEVAKLMIDAGQITLSAFISPFSADRDLVRQQVPAGEFIEVFIDTPLETCIQRDPKGLYAKAIQGEIANFTGIDSPYQAPIQPEIHIVTTNQSVSESVDQIINHLESQNIIQNSTAEVDG